MSKLLEALHTTTPRTDAALAQVARARETESDYKCHDALIKSHVHLEVDYNGLRAEVERLREALQDIVGGASPVDTGRLKEMVSVARAALKKDVAL